MIATLAALAAAGGGYWAGRNGLKLPQVDLPALVTTARTHLGMKPSAPPSANRPASSGPVVYYQDPDGKPSYSLEPKRTEDGREYRAVHASEDVSFDEKPAQTTGPKVGAGERRILYYRNPMGLPDTSPAPKKDSMGMDYIPVYEGEDEGSIVTVSPGKLQRTGVRYESAQRRVVTRSVRAPGSVQLDERRVAVVTLRAEGFIERVENVTTGDRVRKGQALLHVYSPEIAGAGAQYLTGIGFEGARRRLENLAIPPEVINEIERTKKIPITIPWPAPRDGVVLERAAVDGMRAEAGTVLFRIADVSTVWVLADVPEHDLDLIRMGQGVTVTIRSLPGRSFSGKVGLIYPQVMKETRTARVRIELPNPDGILLPDMYADVAFATGADKPAIAVPDSAVIDTGTRQVVILDLGEGRFEPREVKVGARGEGFTEVREGLAEGDRVVVAANFLIDAESNLKAALQAMAAPEAKP
jgi:Cu(I)/Ag(I) efflux system membrane fusion protein